MIFGITAFNDFRHFSIRPSVFLECKKRGREGRSHYGGKLFAFCIAPVRIIQSTFHVLPPIEETTA
jgi:hypothetical protein